jgi:hypothetical protein
VRKLPHAGARRPGARSILERWVCDAGRREIVRLAGGAWWLLAAAMLADCARASAATPAPGDACTLLTPQQVSAILGITVGEGEHVVPDSHTSCGWMGPGGASIGSKKVVLSLMTARSFQSGKTPVKGVTESLAPNIGDEAYYVSMPPFGTALSVRKGATYFQLRIAGFPSGQVRSLERELALQLLDRV